MRLGFSAILASKNERKPKLKRRRPINRLILRFPALFPLPFTDLKKIPHRPGNQNKTEHLVHKNGIVFHPRVRVQPPIPKTPQPKGHEQTGKNIGIHHGFWGGIVLFFIRCHQLTSSIILNSSCQGLLISYPMKF